MTTISNSSRTENETLVAVAGAPGPSAIGVIQLTGLDCRAMLQRFFSKPLPDQPGKILLGDFSDPQGNPIDRVLVVQLPVAGDFFEITCHGGTRIVQRIVDTLEHAGAKLLPAEEFLPDALKLKDPVAREAYPLLIHAKTALAVKFLLHQSQAGLSKLMKNGSKEEFQQTAKYWPAVEYLLNGIKIVLTGPPNSGKSTLLNALGRMDHALVADFPGTTRDYVQTQIDLDGLPVKLLDTAGLGPTSDLLADHVQRLSLQQAKTADCVFIVLDAIEKNNSQKFIEDFQHRLSTQQVIVLINKIDSPNPIWHKNDLELPASWPTLEISALKKTNLKKIPPLVWQLLGLEGFDYRQPTAFTPHLAQCCQRNI
ncbi:MAG: GTPase [Phycisphaerae bacterium]